MRVKVVWAFGVLAMTGAEFLAPTPAVSAGAEPSSSSQALSFIDQPSMDTTPVRVRVVDTDYLIPRNYLVGLGATLPTLRVTFPGFQPFREDTRECLLGGLFDHDTPCRPLEFWLGGGNGPSTRQMFNNLRPLFLSQTSKPTTFGLSMNEIGPLEARQEIYTLDQAGRFVFVACIVRPNKKGKNGICDDKFRLFDGVGTTFRVSDTLLPRVVEIEDGISSIMEKFKGQ